MRPKKILSVCMLLLVIFHGLSPFIIFKVLQAKYRTEIVEMLLNEEKETVLVSFKFDKNELKSGKIKIQWIEDNEFRYNYKMYDVVKSETLNDSIYFYCIEDKKESLLYSNLDRYFQKLIDEDPGKEEDLEGFTNLLSLVYSKPDEIRNDQYNYSDQIYYVDYYPGLMDGVKFSDTPPPRS